MQAGEILPDLKRAEAEAEPSVRFLKVPARVKYDVPLNGQFGIVGYELGQ